jgi:hypothetical protein
MGVFGTYFRRKYIMHQSAIPGPVTDRQTTTLAEIPGKSEAYSSGVSWAAVIGGAFVSASLALILLALGTGLGLSSVSPWSNLGAAASTVGKGAIVWLILTQIMASALGGYLAGRWSRTRPSSFSATRDFGSCSQSRSSFRCLGLHSSR